MAGKRRHEKPLKRVNPSGKTVWVARWRDREGKQHSAGTYATQGPCRNPNIDGDCCAQHAIDHAYDTEGFRASAKDTVGAYATLWLTRHPRSERTNKTYLTKLNAVLPVLVGNRPLRDWPMGELRRRHGTDLVEILLVDQGRSALGAVNVIRVLSAMFEDAVADEWCESNLWKGVKVKASDPRIVKAPRKPVVWLWADSRKFAAAAACSVDGDSPVLNAWRATYAELMLLTLADCGLRLGEMLALHRDDVLDGALRVERTAHKGHVQAGTKTDHGDVSPGRMVPLSVGLEGRLRGLPTPLRSPWLFPTPTGLLWQEHNWYEHVLYPTRKVTGMHVRPHDLRHSWVSQMTKLGADRAALADIAGHSVQTQARYTHAIRDEPTFAAMRAMVGS